MADFTETMRLARMSRRMTQRAAAAQMGISHVHLSNIENGKVDPSVSLIRKIEAVYDIQILNNQKEELVIVKEFSEEYIALIHRQLKDGPQPGERYRHYSGATYIVVGRSIAENSLEPLVTYQSEEKGYVWTRTLKDFMASVAHDDEGSISRFSLFDGK